MSCITSSSPNLSLLSQVQIQFQVLNPLSQVKSNTDVLKCQINKLSAYWRLSVSLVISELISCSLTLKYLIQLVLIFFFCQLVIQLYLKDDTRNQRACHHQQNAENDQEQTIKQSLICVLKGHKQEHYYSTPSSGTQTCSRRNQTKSFITEDIK